MLNCETAGILKGYVTLGHGVSAMYDLPPIVIPLLKSLPLSKQLQVLAAGNLESYAVVPHCIPSVHITHIIVVCIRSKIKQLFLFYSNIPRSAIRREI